MGYYVIYDLNDNIICYLDSLQELCSFTGLRIKDVNYKFKKTLTDYIQVIVDKKILNVYNFC